MHRTIALCFAAATLTAAAPPPADPFEDFGNGSFSMVLQGQQWQKALFICDGTDQGQVLIFGYPDAQGNSVLTIFKAAGSAWSTAAVTIGQGEPGAGQIVYPVSGAMKGVIHAFNPGNVDGATSPAVSSVTLGGVTTSCRFAEGTVLLGVTGQRTVLITATNPGYQYQAFAPGGTTQPSLSLFGGMMSGDAATQNYLFENGDYSYSIDVGGPQGAPSATLTVSQGSKVLATEALVAYTLNGN